MSHNIGFSTGVLLNDLSHKETLAFLHQLGCKVVELGYIRFERLSDGSVEELETSDFDGFDYVSIHAPKITYGKNKDTEFTLTQIKKIDKLRKLDAVVVHPDLVEDFSVLQDTGLNIAFENMDVRKASFQTAKELDELTTRFGFDKFVLDLNHVYTVDASMVMLDEFYELLGDRIVEIQISGYDKLHDPLVETNQKEIVAGVRGRDIPVVDEAGKMSKETVKQELEYILRHLEAQSERPSPPRAKHKHFEQIAT